MQRLREFIDRWRGTLSAAAIAALCEVGARVGLPGVDARVVEQFIRTTHGPLIWFYDFLAGGGVSRGALLAIGIIPYVAARVWLWIGRSVSSELRRATDDTRTRARVVTGLTVGVAAVQSVGYVAFLTSIPAAVASPGPAFVIRSVLLLTGGAVVVSLLAERALPRAVSAEREPSPERATFAVSPPAPFGAPRP